MSVPKQPMEHGDEVQQFYHALPSAPSGFDALLTRYSISLNCICVGPALAVYGASC
jgi:hypothetical protein